MFSPTSEVQNYLHLVDQLLKKNIVINWLFHVHMMLLVSKWEAPLEPQDPHLSIRAFSLCLAPTNWAMFSNYFLFLYFPWNASLHTIIDLNLFLHKLSLFFLAFMALTHHSCHCYKLVVVVVASMVAEDTNCKCQLLPVTPRNKGTGEGEVIKASSPSYQDIFFPNSLSSLGLLLFTFLQFLPDPISNAHGSV